MEKINKDQWVDVQAFKYEGNLYRQWNGTKVIFVSKGFFILLMNKTKVQESNNQKWVVKIPTLWYFSTKDFFNLTISIKPEGLYYYINLASPPYIQDGKIQYIDLDYDIKKYPQKHFVIVDHNDFESNKDKWYDQKLKDVIYKTIAKITEMSMFKKGIFNEKLILKLAKELIDAKEIERKHFEFLYENNENLNVSDKISDLEEANKENADIEKII